MPARRRGPLSLRYLPGSEGPPRVAYALGRAVGPAPVRNRLRRRLRAAVRERAAELAPGAYLLGAGPAAVKLSPTELRGLLAELLRAAGGAR